MNPQTKAKVAVRRAAADLLERDAAKMKLPTLRAAADELTRELRAEADKLAAAPPDPHRQYLTERAARLDKLVGGKVRLLRTIALKSGARYPAGHLMTVERIFRGKACLDDGKWYASDGRVYEVAEEAPAHSSGHRGYLRRVDLRDFELVAP